MPQPYLTSERHFRLYESYLQEIVKAWPNPSIFTPKPPVASVETLSSRIRICNQALVSNIQSNEPRWSTTIDTMKFLLITDELVVSITAVPGKVCCGPIDAVKALGVPVGVPCETIVEQRMPKINLVEPSEELLLAVLVFHHCRMLNEPSIIVVSEPLLQATIIDFVGSHDIAVTKNDNVYTIL
jgi:hypothetical protein